MVPLAAGWSSLQLATGAERGILLLDVMETQHLGERVEAMTGPRGNDCF
jgi:hypothetical protein